MALVDSSPVVRRVPEILWVWLWEGTVRGREAIVRPLCYTPLDVATHVTLNESKVSKSIT